MKVEDCWLTHMKFTGHDVPKSLDVRRQVLYKICLIHKIKAIAY